MQNCYNRGKGDDDRLSQDERLTKKHIETLSFVQELGLQNKELKARVEELETERLKCKEIHDFAKDSKERLTKLQEQFLKRTDEVTAMMTEKHRAEMMKQAEMKIDMEQRMQAEIDRLKSAIEKLESENRHLSEELSKAHQDEEVEGLRKQLEEARLEISALRAEREDSNTVQDRTVADLEQSEAVREANSALTKELKEANQKNRELKFRISKLERELEDAKSDRIDQDLVDSLTNRLTKVQEDNQALQQRETEYNSLVNKLYSDIQGLTQTLAEVDADRGKLKMEYGNLVAEIVNLKKKLRVHQEKQNFKEFVALKREITLLKEENNQLREKSFEKRTSLPTLKATLCSTGDISSAKKDKKLTSQKPLPKLTQIPSICD